MTLTGVRINVFNENFLNETEQDANSVLTELDKGLRSPRIGVQCEAIVRFPRLFEKYPFPILINSSFLKLAEFFWNGSNLLRFWVLKVCQQSENHLDKILNTEAFVKRIFMVTHSNDPIARAITLRTLGAVSRVVSEKQQIHHCIRRALDSHDMVEVEAAVYASTQFAAQSKIFAVSMCSKIASMIELFQTPISMKLQLIPVLRCMHHDANTAAIVKDLCLTLLPKYPAEHFVITILESLTYLSSKTLIGIPAQIQLLLEYLSDPRKKVRYQTLRLLIKLAKAQSTQCWSETAVTELLLRAETCVELHERTLLLKVFLVLVECPFSCNLFYKNQERVIKLCKFCLNFENHTAASLALAILSGIVLNRYKSLKQPYVILELINTHLESLLFSALGNPQLSKELRKYLICGVKLSEYDKDFGKDFIEMIVDFIIDESEYPVNHSKLLCLTLAALSSVYQTKKFLNCDRDVKKKESQCSERQKENIIEERIPHVLKKLNSIIKLKPESATELIEILCAISLQTLLGCYIPKIIIETINRTALVTNCWNQYRIGRSALRYGQHFLGATVFLRIAGRTTMDKYHFFLIGIAKMAEAEHTLNSGMEFSASTKSFYSYSINSEIKVLPLIKRLEIVINLYWKALANFRACSSSTNPLNFQLEFLKIRCQLTQALLGIVLAKNSQTIIPPPAIAASLAQNARDYLQKFGHITHQLRKITKMVKLCEQSYFRLYNSAFDADPVTLEYLEIAKYQCAILGYILETICYASASERPVNIIQSRHPETRYFQSVCEKIVAMSKQLSTDSSNTKTISSKHMDLLINIIEITMKSPLCVPRYFFQTLQSTQIKLSISPQPRVSGEPITVQCGGNLVIKVEGVIQHFGKQANLYRTMKYVQLILTAQPLSRSSSDYNKNSNEIMLSQTVRPQRNFLSGCFLLPVSAGGQWHVTLETFLIDENRKTWCAGVRNSMTVRVLEDSLKTGTPSFHAAPSRRF